MIINYLLFIYKTIFIIYYFFFFKKKKKKKKKKKPYTFIIIKIFLFLF